MGKENYENVLQDIPDDQNTLPSIFKTSNVPPIKHIWT